MPNVETWNQVIIDGKRYLQIEVAQLRIPLDWDPSSNVFIAVAVPSGGVLNYPALLQGEDGATPDIDQTIAFTALDPLGSTAPYASWEEYAPNRYKLHLGLYNGLKGSNGTTVLDINGFAGHGPKKMLVFNPAGTAIIAQTQKVGDWHYPALVNDIPTGNPNFTICQIPIPPYDFDYRVDVDGQQLLTATSEDVAVDLIARLGSANGSIIGRAIGGVGMNPPTHILSGGAPWNLRLDGNYDKVALGNSTTIFIRAERRAGTGTFSGYAANAFFRAKVDAIPA